MLVWPLLLGGCYPTPGPDKSAVGAVLGGAWGAGGGAIIGHQVGALGPGAAIGGGLGAASGIMTGIGLDVAEGTELQMQRELDSLEVQVASNQRSLVMLQDALDERERQLGQSAAGNTVFFDEGRASLRSGTVTQLERLANSIKRNPFVGAIEVHGHTDETGNVETNNRLSEARAKTVATFLGSHGISMDQIATFSHGATRPLATNDTDMGKQLNRRVEVVLIK